MTSWYDSYFMDADEPLIIHWDRHCDGSLDFWISYVVLPCG